MLKILLIEDNDNIRENTSEILMLAGYKVFAVNNGEEGLIAASQIRPDLIICDIVMQGLSGLEVFSELKCHGELKDTPFVFMSAKIDRPQFGAGRDPGADDFITKPFDAEQLLGAVSRNIRKSTTIMQAGQHSNPTKQEQVIPGRAKDAGSQ